MLIVGLTLAQRPRIDAALTQLDIDLDILEDEWVPEVRSTLRAQIRELIRAGRYDDTRAPSESLTRLLPFWVTSDNARRKTARPVARYTVSADAIDLRGLLSQPKPRRRLTWGGKGLFAAALAIVAIMMTASAVLGPGKTVHILKSAELAEISPHLSSAQRSQFGYGSAMAGKLGDDWHDLDEQQQYERALKIAAQLRTRGVREVVLSDAERRLQIQISGGKLRYPERP